MSVEHCGVEPDIYAQLALHQQTSDWPDEEDRKQEERRELFGVLHGWAERLNLRFRLEIPSYSLCVERLSRGTLGHYRGGVNGFGLRHEIAIDERHIGSEPNYEVLGTLLHELLHCWQKTHGKPGKGNYHNVAFRRKAERYGLIVNQYGHTEYVDPSPFTDVLREHGVRLPELPEKRDLRRRSVRGSSKMRLWECPCGVKVRVGRRFFRARCLNCGGLFELKLT